MKQTDLLEVQEAAQEASALLKTLANENRLMLLCQMVHSEKSVQELESALAIHQPTLSQQLCVLRQAGFVMTRREGKKIYYKLSDPKVIAVIQLLYELFCKNEA